MRYAGVVIAYSWELLRGMLFIVSMFIVRGSKVVLPNRHQLMGYLLWIKTHALSKKQNMGYPGCLDTFFTKKTLCHVDTMLLVNPLTGYPRCITS